MKHIWMSSFNQDFIFLPIITPCPNRCDETISHCFISVVISADVFYKGSCITELISRTKSNNFNTDSIRERGEGGGKVKSCWLVYTKCAAVRGFTDFLLLLCAQSQSWKWDVKWERPRDWDVDKILTCTGYLKPLTFFQWLGCWKRPHPPAVAGSKDAVSTLSQVNEEKWSWSKIYPTHFDLF